MKLPLLLIGTLLCLCANSAHGQFVDARMGFSVYEINAPSGAVHHDTCGIHTGATDGQDDALGEIDWPPPFGSVFDATWVAPGARLRLDLRRPPSINAPPYVVDYEIEINFSLDQDTISLAWNGLPAGIDSIHIEDSIPGHPPGEFFDADITHSTAPADSLLWWKPEGGNIDLTRLRVRVFYNRTVADDVKGITSVAVPSLLTLTPNPAHTQVAIDAPANTDLVISDILGRVVRHVAARAGRPVTVTIADLAAGTYAVSTTGRGSLAHSLLIVE